jgi:hypothetical protein
VKLAGVAHAALHATHLVPPLLNVRINFVTSLACCSSF